MVELEIISMYNSHVYKLIKSQGAKKEPQKQYTQTAKQAIRDSDTEEVEYKNKYWSGATS